MMDKNVISYSLPYVGEFDPNLFYTRDVPQYGDNGHVIGALRRQAIEALSSLRHWRSIRDDFIVEAHGKQRGLSSREYEMQLFYIEDVMCITERCFKEIYACYRLAREAE